MMRGRAQVYLSSDYFELALEMRAAFLSHGAFMLARAPTVVNQEARETGCGSQGSWTRVTGWTGVVDCCGDCRYRSSRRTRLQRRSLLPRRSGKPR
jgi:hypothetical protein